MHLSQSRKAFTVLEVTVVFGITVVLFAVLAVSVQKAREQALLTQCQANLRQVVLAMHSYHDLHRHLPTGQMSLMGGADPSPQPSQYYRYGCWFQHILPYVEQGALQARLDAYVAANPASEASWPANGIYHAPGHETVVPAFVCPSDPNGGKVLTYTKDAVPTVVALNGGTGGGMSAFSVEPDTTAADASSGAAASQGFHGNYVANAGKDYFNPAGALLGTSNLGVFYVGSKTQLTDITDGASCTLLLSEILLVPDSDSHDDTRGRYYKTYWGESMFTTLHGPNAGIDSVGQCVSTDYSPCNEAVTTSAPSAVQGVSSNHPSGVNVAFSDGSTRFVRNDVSLLSWQGVSTRAANDINDLFYVPPPFIVTTDPNQVPPDNNGINCGFMARMINTVRQNEFTGILNYNDRTKWQDNLFANRLTACVSGDNSNWNTYNRLLGAGTIGSALLPVNYPAPNVAAPAATFPVLTPSATSPRLQGSSARALLTPTAFKPSLAVTGFKPTSTPTSATAAKAAATAFKPSLIASAYAGNTAAPNGFSAANDTISFAAAHGLVNGQAAIATNNNGGLTSGTTYFVSVVDANTIKLYTDVALTSLKDLTGASTPGALTIRKLTVGGHGLSDGASVLAAISKNGLTGGQAYYVRVLDANSFQLHTSASLDALAGTSGTNSFDGLLTISGHGLANGNSIIPSVTTAGALTAGTTYYVRAIDADTVQVHTASGLNALANLTALQSGGFNGVVTLNNHGLNSGNTAVASSASGGLSQGSTYYVGKIDANRFQLFTDAGLTSLVALTGTPSGLNGLATVAGHGLTDGSDVTASASTGGLTAGAKYFVKAIDANTVQLYTSNALTTLVNVTGQPAAFDGLLTVAGHGLANNSTVVPAATQGGLSFSTVYYVRSIDANTLQVYTTSGPSNLAALTALPAPLNGLLSFTAAHGLSDGALVVPGHGSIAGLAQGTPYYARVVTSTQVQLYSDPGLTTQVSPSGAANGYYNSILSFASPHGLSTGDPLAPGATGGGLNLGSKYYARVVTPNVVQVYSDAGTTTSTTAVSGSIGAVNGILRFSAAHGIVQGTNAVIADSSSGGLIAGTPYWVYQPGGTGNTTELQLFADAARTTLAPISGAVTGAFDGGCVFGSPHNLADGTKVNPSANVYGLSTGVAYFTKSSPSGNPAADLALVLTTDAGLTTKKTLNPTPAGAFSLNLLNQTLTLNTPHGLSTGAAVAPVADGNGLFQATTYYVAAPASNQLRFYLTPTDATNDTNRVELFGTSFPRNFWVMQKTYTHHNFYSFNPAPAGITATIQRGPTFTPEYKSFVMDFTTYPTNDGIPAPTFTAANTTIEVRLHEAGYVNAGSRITLKNVTLSGPGLLGAVPVNNPETNVNTFTVTDGNPRDWFIAGFSGLSSGFTLEWDMERSWDYTNSPSNSTTQMMIFMY